MERCDPNAKRRCPDGKNCELYAEFADGSWCDIFNESALKQPMTNADRIRAKISSDEGIADILLALDITLAEDGGDFTRLYCHGDNGCVDENDDITCNDEMRKACILRWLRQPVEEI